MEYLEIIVTKYGSRKGGMKGRVVNGGQATGSVKRIMKGRNVSVEVKR